MKFQLKPWNKDLTNDEVLTDLRRVAAELGKSNITYDEYEANGLCSCRLLERRFGSWNDALAKAGLPVSRRSNVPQEELFENLRLVWEKLGQQPSRKDMQRPTSAFSGGCYEKRFHGWRNALKHFIAWVQEDSGDDQAVSVGDIARINRSPRSPSTRLRFQVLQRDRFRCCACGKSPATDAGVELHVDHIKPWVSGGLTVRENLQSLCSSCNYGKGATPPDFSENTNGLCSIPEWHAQESLAE
jgi:hypothetical protein